MSERSQAQYNVLGSPQTIEDLLGVYNQAADGLVFAHSERFSPITLAYEAAFGQEMAEPGTIDVSEVVGKVPELVREAVEPAADDMARLVNEVSFLVPRLLGPEDQGVLAAALGTADIYGASSSNVADVLDGASSQKVREVFEREVNSRHKSEDQRQGYNGSGYHREEDLFTGGAGKQQRTRARTQTATSGERNASSEGDPYATLLSAVQQSPEHSDQLKTLMSFPRGEVMKGKHSKDSKK